MDRVRSPIILHEGHTCWQNMKCKRHVQHQRQLFQEDNLGMQRHHLTRTLCQPCIACIGSDRHRRHIALLRTSCRPYHQFQRQLFRGYSLGTQRHRPTWTLCQPRIACIGSGLFREHIVQQHTICSLKHPPQKRSFQERNFCTPKLSSHQWMQMLFQVYIGCTASGRSRRHTFQRCKMCNSWSLPLRRLFLMCNFGTPTHLWQRRM